MESALLGTAGEVPQLRILRFPCACRSSVEQGCWKYSQSVRCPDTELVLSPRLIPPRLWAREYPCATVGAVDEKTIMEYMENQKWDDDDQ